MVWTRLSLMVIIVYIHSSFTHISYNFRSSDHPRLANLLQKSVRKSARQVHCIPYRFFAGLWREPIGLINAAQGIGCLIVSNKMTPIATRCSTIAGLSLRAIRIWYPWPSRGRVHWFHHHARRCLIASRCTQHFYVDCSANDRYVLYIHPEGHQQDIDWNTVGLGLTLCLNASPLLLIELSYPTQVCIRVHTFFPSLLTQLQRGKITSLYNTSWYMGSIISAWACFGTFTHEGGSVWSWRMPTLIQAFVPVLQVCLIWYVSMWWFSSPMIDAVFSGSFLKVLGSWLPKAWLVYLFFQ